jgi:FkbM family methyltransferase
LASLPFELLSSDARARAVERLAEESVITTATARGPISFCCISPQLATRARTLLSKEPDTINWIENFAANSVFWDVGANVGGYSLYAAAGGNLSVLSFEPSAANFYILSRNLHLNEFAGNVKAYCLALSGRTELGMLNLAAATAGAALHQFGQLGEMSPYCDGQSGLAHGMIGFTIDDFVEQFQPPFPNYLKVDVDGLELPILQGAQKTLREPRLRSLMIELCDNRERAAAISLAEDCGLTLQSVGAAQGNERISGANHLFLRR